MIIRFEVFTNSLFNQRTINFELTKNLVLQGNQYKQELCWTWNF